MKEKVISILVGFVIFSILGIIYKILIDDTFSWEGVVIMSVFQSLGIVVLVPFIVRMGQKYGWIRKG